MSSFKAFQSLHNQYLIVNPIVHAYAEPNGNTKPAVQWYLCMSTQKDLVDKGFKDYIHPEGDVINGYGDHCSIEKGTFDFDNMRIGEVFPAILYSHHETILTVSCVVTLLNGPALYIYYPSKDNLEQFKKHKEELFTYDKYKVAKAAIDDRFLFDESYSTEDYRNDDISLSSKLDNLMKNSKNIEDSQAQT